MRPPPEVIEFVVSGSSNPDLTRKSLESANFYGSESMWILLSPNGELIGRLDDKIPPYRLKPGHVEWYARQLDGPG